jgi:hypothetical protein
MSDDELDRLVAALSPINDVRVASLDLREAEVELLEAIIAMPATDMAVPRGTPSNRSRARRAPYRASLALAVAAAVALAVLGLNIVKDGGEPADVATGQPAEVPRLIPDPVPDGFELDRATDWPPAGWPDEMVSAFQTSSDEIPMASTAHSIRYAPPNTPPGGASLWIATRDGTAADAARWATEMEMPGGEAPRIEVRGHEGWTLSQPLEDWLGLLWEEAPGVYVSVVATDTDLTEADVLDVAESLRPATAAEWDAALRADDQSVASYIPDDAVVTIDTAADFGASGMLGVYEPTTDSEGIAVYLAAEGQLCAFLVDAEGKLPETCVAEGTRVQVLRDRAGEPVMLFGFTPAGTGDVLGTFGDMPAEVAESGPQPLIAYLEPVPGAEHQIYGMPLSLVVDSIPDTLTFRNQQGEPIESVPVDLG